MKFEFIERNRSTFPVECLCRVLRVSRSGYYAWRQRGTAVSERLERRRELCEAIALEFERSSDTYGSPRIYEALIAHGFECSQNTVARLMRMMGVRPAITGVYHPCTTDSDHDHEVPANLLNREFDQKRKNSAWASDITYIPTDQGWLYLAVVIDLYSRRVIGWAMADHLRASLATDALQMAIEHRGETDYRGLIHHSDRGIQYASDAYQKMLSDNAMTCSMSRKGNCWDNAVVESFFGTLKVECIRRHRFTSRAEARTCVFKYIEGFYNTRRLHSSLGYLSPVEYELVN